MEDINQVTEVNDFIQSLSKPAEGNLELSITSVSDFSINSDKEKPAEEEDNEPIDMQALLDKESQFDHLTATEDSSAPFRDVSESEYVPKSSEDN